MGALTPDDVIGLAPDARSVEAARPLVSVARWRGLGSQEGTLWGECRGSTWYQVSVDLAAPSFRCTCPSPKVPGKPALALLLLHAARPEASPRAEPPPWVAEQREAAAAREARRTARKARGGDVADPEAQARRAAEREAKVAAGLEELARWLRDLVRQGLAGVQGRPYAFWDATAARLVDAQAPGLARLVRELAGIAASGEGWAPRLLERLARLHLLVEAARRPDRLPEDVRADVRTLVGWTVSQDELRQAPGVRDLWRVVGERIDEEDRYRVQRTWLVGARTGRAAVIVGFGATAAPPDRTFPPGTEVEAELVFWPGATPLRAIAKARHGDPRPLATLPGHPDATSALTACGEELARNPWLELQPVGVLDVVPRHAAGRWLVADTAGRALPLVPRGDAGWRLVALSGGRPIAIFGEWDGEALRPLSAHADGRWVGVAT